MTLAAFLALASVQMMAAISPGPAVLMTARTGISRGMRAGVFLAAGIGAGAVFWAACALFGLGVIFKVAPALLTVLKVVGGLWLVWIAIQMWRHAAEPLGDSDDAAPPTARAAFWRGITVQLANPKPVVFSARSLPGWCRRIPRSGSRPRCWPWSFRPISCGMCWSRGSFRWIAPAPSISRSRR
ncbi:LysE family translocator [Gemmobacter lanyuensis]